MSKPINNVYDSNERLIRLVNDLLSVSRIEAGKLELSLNKTRIEDTLISIIEELQNEAKLKNIELKWDKPKKPISKILIDEEKVRQIFLNLIDNAIKYTKKGSVTTKIKEFPSKIQITITDTGEGISKAEMDKIFKSFSRGSAGNKSYVEGVGLGLYIARQFTDMHKGKIWAVSKGKGKGTTFYVELPKSNK
ncbi:unnamed protein product [marine sediment metagenome]|uniref:histidine kinase n=1 Tax=marine sediment metagenome TaxID=412755 RepID=X0RF58_9ZZZZ